MGEYWRILQHSLRTIRFNHFSLIYKPWEISVIILYQSSPQICYEYQSQYAFPRIWARHLPHYQTHRYLKLTDNEDFREVIRYSYYPSPRQVWWPEPGSEHYYYPENIHTSLTTRKDEKARLKPVGPNLDSVNPDQFIFINEPLVLDAQCVMIHPESSKDHSKTIVYVGVHWF